MLVIYIYVYVRVYIYIYNFTHIKQIMVMLYSRVRFPKDGRCVDSRDDD